MARFPGKVALAEGDFDLVIEGVLGADMGALGIGVGTDGAEALKSGQSSARLLRLVLDTARSGAFRGRADFGGFCKTVPGRPGRLAWRFFL